MVELTIEDLMEQWGQEYRSMPVPWRLQNEERA